MCGKKWRHRAEFLDDPELSFIGYQANLGLPEEGLFFFNHEAAECGSTIALSVAFFLSLYTGPRYPDSKINSQECRGLCLNRLELQRCTALCRYAYVREVSEIIRNRRR